METSTPSEYIPLPETTEEISHNPANAMDSSGDMAWSPRKITGQKRNAREEATENPDIVQATPEIYQGVMQDLNIAPVTTEEETSDKAGARDATPPTTEEQGLI